MGLPDYTRNALTVAWLLAAFALSAGARAAEPAPDFARDIQPIFKKHCYECHGPDKQRNGYRLDRRSAAFGGLVRHNIIAGDSSASRVYRRVLDSHFGIQMPPEDALAPEDIETIRRWIDAGAHWSDELANESELPPPDEQVVQLAGLIRASVHHAASRREVLARVRADPALVNGRGMGGTTPLMEAALYGDARLLSALLDLGGNPRARNDRDATALLWAVDDLAKVRLLLDRGADPNVGSDFGETPLTQAAVVPGSAPIVKLLLERGAEVGQGALTAAARANPAALKLLLSKAADKGAAATMALRSNCVECMALLPNTPIPRGLLATLPVAGPGDPHQLRMALDRQPDVNLRDNKDRTPLMAAASSELAPPELIKLLLERGADAHARSMDGLNALDFALRLGRPESIAVLESAGARPAYQDARPTPARVADNDARAAIARSMPLLQNSGLTFYDRGGCVSCHHNLLGLLTTRTLREQRLPFDVSIETLELRVLVDDLANTRDQALQGIVVPGGLATTTGYLLLSLDAAKHPPDATTDALVRLLRRAQMPDGSWLSAVRPPSEASMITAAAVGLRGLQVYGDRGSPGDRRAIAKARDYLLAAKPTNSEELTFRLLGLSWANASAPRRRAAIDALLSQQRADGGWAQLPYRESDAYATGQALVALREAGVAVDSAAYQRGVRFLLDTQLVDGSWLVRTRSNFTQIYFESGFPHGAHQFISAAATHWATQALAWSLPPTGNSGSAP